MKTTIAILLICASAFSQNVLVTFWPTNQPYQGLTNWPQGAKPVSWSTNTPGWATNMTLANYSAYVAAQQPVYDAGVSNALYSANVNISSNAAAWQAMYVQIPLGISDSSNRIFTLGNLIASWNSGTNNAAGTNSIIKQTMQNVQVSYQYLNQIIVYLSRLGPGLQQVYQPANDPVGH